MPLTMIVLNIAKTAVGGNSAVSRGLPGNIFFTDSCRICRKLTIIIIEKTRMPGIINQLNHSLSGKGLTDQ